MNTRPTVSCKDASPSRRQRSFVGLNQWEQIEARLHPLPAMEAVLCGQFNSHLHRVAPHRHRRYHLVDARRTQLVGQQTPPRLSSVPARRTALWQESIDDSLNGRRNPRVAPHRPRLAVLRARGRPMRPTFYGQHLARSERQYRTGGTFGAVPSLRLLSARPNSHPPLAPALAPTARPFLRSVGNHRSARVSSVRHRTINCQATTSAERSATVPVFPRRLSNDMQRSERRARCLAWIHSRARKVV